MLGYSLRITSKSSSSSLNHGGSLHDRNPLGKISTFTFQNWRFGQVFLPTQDLGFCYPAFATIKAAMRTATGTVGLISERSSGRDLFLRLRFAVDEVGAPGEAAAAALDAEGGREGYLDAMASGAF
jgi:hypothetical protein